MATGNAEAFAGREYTEDYLADLYEVLHKISAKYKSFGLQIGLKITKIEEIEADKSKSTERLLEVLTKRVRMTPPLTCAIIVKALRSNTVEEYKMANEIGNSLITDQQKKKIKIEMETCKEEKSVKSALNTSDTSEIAEYLESEGESSSNESRNELKTKSSKKMIPAKCIKAQKRKKTTATDEDLDVKKSQPKRLKIISGETDREPYSEGTHRSVQKSKRKQVTTSDSSETDSSSSECEQLKYLTASNKKSLIKIFKCSFGKLCVLSFDPAETASLLIEKGLITQRVMKEMIISPESQQIKRITLVTALDKKIKSHPDKLFACIEVLLKSDILQEAGKDMLRKTG